MAALVGTTVSATMKALRMDSVELKKDLMGISGVDVEVACNAEGGGVSLACDAVGACSHTW